MDNPCEDMAVGKKTEERCACAGPFSLAFRCFSSTIFAVVVPRHTHDPTSGQRSLVVRLVSFWVAAACLLCLGLLPCAGAYVACVAAPASRPTKPGLLIVLS